MRDTDPAPLVPEVSSRATDAVVETDVPRQDDVPETMAPLVPDISY